MLLVASNRTLQVPEELCVDGVAGRQTVVLAVPANRGAGPLPEQPVVGTRLVAEQRQHALRLCHRAVGPQGGLRSVRAVGFRFGPARRAGLHPVR